MDWQLIFKSPNWYADRIKDDESIEAKTECEKRKQQTYREREQEWLKRIKAMRGERILVVCGAAHITPFNKLLNKNNFNVKIECSLWE